MQYVGLGKHHSVAGDMDNFTYVITGVSTSATGHDASDNCLLEGCVVLVVTVGIIVSNVVNIIVWSRVGGLAPVTKFILVNLSVSDILVGSVACAPSKMCCIILVCVCVCTTIYIFICTCIIMFTIDLNKILSLSLSLSLSISLSLSLSLSLYRRLLYVFYNIMLDIGERAFELMFLVCNAIPMRTRRFTEAGS